MRSLPKELLDRTVAAGHAWGVAADGIPTTDGDFGAFEHLVHELAHAKLLGLDMGPALSKRIGDALKVLPHAAQVSNEAMTWAIETHVLIHYDLFLDDEDDRLPDVMGLPDDIRVDWTFVYEGAQMQGCRNEHVDLYYYHGDLEEIAHEVVQTINGVDPTATPREAAA